MKRITAFYKSVLAFAKKRKITFGVIVVAILGIGWWTFAALSGGNTETRYVLANVTKGTVVQSVSASGQVSASDQIDLKPKGSGEITWIGVKAGDTVYAGQALASLDATDAKQAVLDAQDALTQAQLQYQKDSAQAPIDFTKAQQSVTDAQTDLVTEYNNVYDTISSTYLNLPTVMTGADNTLYSYSLSNSQWNIAVFRNAFTNGDDYTTMGIVADSAERDYKAARAEYDTDLTTYKTMSRTSDKATLESFLSESEKMATAVSQAMQSEVNLLDTYVDIMQRINRPVPSGVTSLQTSARTYLSTANSTLSSILAEEKALLNAKRAVTDNQNSLDILQIGNTASGTNPISLQSEYNNLQSQRRKLQDLKDALADYTVFSPFSGTVASVSAKVHDTASSGTTLASVITTQKIAELSLNEVDAAKLKLGDKATLTFDAIDGLTLTGSIAEIDPVGTVSQGVVSYDIKITFDAQDERVKPGMTVNAAIITASKTDVLTVPASAIKTVGGQSVVQIFEPALSDTGGTQGVASKALPTSVPVEVGISDDTTTEITSGLTEGEQIVARTVTAAASAAQAQSSAPSLFGGGARAGGGTGGGNARFQTRGG